MFVLFGFLACILCIDPLHISSFSCTFYDILKHPNTEYVFRFLEARMQSFYQVQKRTACPSAENQHQSGDFRFSMIGMLVVGLIDFLLLALSRIHPGGFCIVCFADFLCALAFLLMPFDFILVTVLLPILSLFV